MPPLAAKACSVRFGMPAINAASEMPTRSAVTRQPSPFDLPALSSPAMAKHQDYVLLLT
jgi:hypothetical protein